MKLFCHPLLVLVSTLVLDQVKAAETVYFLVAATPGWVAHNDFYVLPLTKQEDIDHARYLISRWQSGYLEADRPLVLAAVGPGNDAINRNYRDSRFPEQSWHVVAFHEFNDYIIEILDGSPTILENDPAWYGGQDSRQGLIGFWGYTVVKELGPVPLYLSIVGEGQNLEFYWSGVGTNYVNTVESKEALARTNWFPIHGATWPLRTNHWTLALTNAPAPFYRVKAEQAKE